MVSTKPVRGDPDDSPDAVLVRALRLEIAGYWAWKRARHGVWCGTPYSVFAYTWTYIGVWTKARLPWPGKC